MTDRSPVPVEVVVERGGDAEGHLDTAQVLADRADQGQQVGGARNLPETDWAGGR